MIDEYLQRGGTPARVRSWDDPVSAPGNDKVRIKSACVVSQADSAAPLLFVNMPIRMDFEIWNNLGPARLNLTAHLSTLEGTHVFASGSGPKMLAQGIVKGSMKIPAHFLNDGTYLITLQIVQDGAESLFMSPELISFEVHDIERSGHWHGKWPGVIRPQMEWSLENA